MTPERERAPVGEPGLSNKSAIQTDDTEFIRPPRHTLPFGSTQREKVVWLQLSSDAVCSTTFLEEYIPRAAAVVHKLRQDGYVPFTRRCNRGHRHQNPQIEYVLEALPYDPKSGAA